jgi:hypothetical protein
VKQLASPIMTAARIRRFSLLLLAGLVLAGSASSAIAEQVMREQDVVNLRLGQHVLVDDGSCPAGQIKEVYGARMTESGILRSVRCIPRSGTKK